MVIGATADGEKGLIALEDGYRESEPPGKEVLLVLKRRGLSAGPECAVVSMTVIKCTKRAV
ncbi:MAG TPA: hypothetical protein VLH40_09660 [Atribacteraceae bacterium]|nr:hypothetical protein [Atribacteraceae bacterium]